MFTNKFFNILLNLGNDWEVFDVEADYQKEDIIIKIKYTKNLITSKDTNYKIYDHAPE